MWARRWRTPTYFALPSGDSKTFDGMADPGADRSPLVAGTSGRAVCPLMVDNLQPRMHSGLRDHPSGMCSVYATEESRTDPRFPSYRLPALPCPTLATRLCPFKQWGMAAMLLV